MKTKNELINDIEQTSDKVYNASLNIFASVFQLKNLASNVYTMCDDSELADFSDEVYHIAASVKDTVDHIICDSEQLKYYFKSLMIDII